MENLKWIEVKTKFGKCESASKLDPMPLGPYLILSQFEYYDFIGKKWTDVLDAKKENLKPIIPDYMFGRVALGNIDGIAMAVYKHFDTSD